MIADKAYDADERVINVLQKKGIKIVIPSKRHRKVHRPHDKQLYKARHHIENFFAKLKQYRAVATRYDKLDTTFLAAIYMVATVIWLK